MAGIFKNLDKSDVRLTPFRAYKRFTHADSYATYSAVLNTSAEQYGNSAVLDPQSTTYYTTNNKSKSSVWNSIDSLFYRHYYSNPLGSFGQIDLRNQPRLLSQEAIVVSLPQSQYGESVERLSFSLVAGSTTYVDDLYGNITISNNTWSSGLISASNLMFSTRPTFFTKQLETTQTRQVSYVSDPYNSDVELQRVTITTSSLSINPGETCFKLSFTAPSTTSSLTIKPENDYLNSLFNFTNRDFAISFIYQSSSLDTNEHVILEKRSKYAKPVLDVNGATRNTLVTQNLINKYPYVITYQPSTNKLSFVKSNGATTLTVTSSFLYDGTQLTTLSRSGSEFIWINGSNSMSFSDSLMGVNGIEDVYCANNCDIRIGASDSPTIAAKGSNGTIGAVNFFDTYIDRQRYDAMSGSLKAANSPSTSVGNIFRKHGLVVITDPIAVNNIKASGITSLEYRGTTTFYENEISCTIRPGELGRSTNPTMYYYNPAHNQFELQDFATGSGFVPYITRVGLYNDNNELIVIGSLSQPIQLPQNVDTTIIVKYDV